MPIPERLRPKADSYAMKAAATRLRGSQQAPPPKPTMNDMNAEAVETEKVMKCPSCGHEGMEMEFEPSEEQSGEGDPLMETEE